MVNASLLYKINQIQQFIDSIECSSEHSDFIVESLHNDLDNVLHSISLYKTESLSSLQKFTSDLSVTYQHFLPYYLWCLCILQQHQGIQRN